MSAPLSPEQRTTILAQLEGAQPATDGLIESFASSIYQRTHHEHPTWEDLFCMNLSSYMGERAAPVLRRLLDAETRVAELTVEVSALQRDKEAAASIVERALGPVIDARDEFHDVADRLAYAVAPIEVIGEHSGGNDPWTNALELVTPHAEVERLRARVTELEESPLAWAEQLDAKSLDNLLISLSQAADHEPMSGALDQVHEVLRGFRTAAVEMGEVLRCGACKNPFDPADTSFDGRAQQGSTGFCRRCVDRCHESLDAFHVCGVCRTAQKGANA